jgi:hypothetical protein
MQFALGEKYDKEIPGQEGVFGGIAVWVTLVRLSFPVLLFLKISLWSHKHL